MKEIVEEQEALIARPGDLPKSVTSIDAKSHTELDKVADTPIFPLNLREFSNILILLIKSSAATSVTLITSYMNGLVSLAFISRYATSIELAGASLAISLGNMFLLSLMASINQGFGVVAAQLYGARQYKEMGLLFQRNVCVLLALSSPFLLVLPFVDYILIALGTNPEVSRCTAIFGMYIIPSLISLYTADCVRAFLLAQNNISFAGFIHSIMLVFHTISTALFVVKFDMPFIGPAIARCITDVTCTLILLTYLRFNSVTQKTMVPISKQCLRGWGQHIIECFTIGFNTYVGQILLEFSTIIIIYLNDEYVIGAHSLAIIILSTFYMLPLGNNLSTLAKVGNAVGEGSKNKAQKFLAGGIFLNTIICISLMTVMIVFKHEIVDLFTRVPQTNAILCTFLIVNCINVPADNFKDIFAGILRATGQQKEVLRVLIIGYVVIGINAEWIFALALKIGYIGIWIGIGFSLYVTTTILFVKVLRLNWDEEIAKVQKHLKRREDTLSKDTL